MIICSLLYHPQNSVEKESALKSIYILKQQIPKGTLMVIEESVSLQNITTSKPQFILDCFLLEREYILYVNSNILLQYDFITQLHVFINQLPRKHDLIIANIDNNIINTDFLFFTKDKYNCIKEWVELNDILQNDKTSFNKIISRYTKSLINFDNYIMLTTNKSILEKEFIV